MVINSKKRVKLGSPELNLVRKLLRHFLHPFQFMTVEVILRLKMSVMLIFFYSGFFV